MHVYMHRYLTTNVQVLIITTSMSCNLSRMLLWVSPGSAPSIYCLMQQGLEMSLQASREGMPFVLYLWSCTSWHALMHEERLVLLAELPRASSTYTYIYIYICREREREYTDMHSHTTHTHTRICMHIDLC